MADWDRNRQQWEQYPAYQMQYGFGGAPPRLPSAKKKNDVPIYMVVAAGVVIWVLLFGGIFAYAAVSPCGFLRTVSGRGTIEAVEEAQDIDLSKTANCREFLRRTVIGG